MAAAVAAFILAPEIGIPTMPLQFKVSHQNNHSLPKIPRNSHMCACHNKKALDWHTCVPVNKECTSQQLIFLSLLTTQAHTNSGKGRQWRKQINMVSLLLEDYYCLKTRLGLVGGLAIAFIFLSPFSLFYVNRWLRLT